MGETTLRKEVPRAAWSQEGHCQGRSINSQKARKERGVGIPGREAKWSLGPGEEVS